MASNVSYNNFDVKGLDYKKPSRNAKGGATVFINKSSSDSGNARVQLEKCRVPFGVRDGMEEGARKSLDLAVSSEALKEFCAKMDEQNVQKATENSELWFKSKMSQEVVKEFYRTMITPSSKAEYDPLLRIKISERPGSETKVFVMEGEKDWKEGTLADVTEHCHVLPIVNIQMLWFVQKQFGMSVVATDLLVWPSARRAERTFDFILPAAAAPPASTEEATEEPGAKRQCTEDSS